MISATFPYIQFNNIIPVLSPDWRNFKLDYTHFWTQHLSSRLWNSPGITSVLFWYWDLHVLPSFLSHPGHDLASFSIRTWGLVLMAPSWQHAQYASFLPDLPAPVLDQPSHQCSLSTPSGHMTMLMLIGVMGGKQSFQCQLHWVVLYPSFCTLRHWCSSAEHFCFIFFK